MLHSHQQNGKRTLAQVFLGRSEDPALLRALRVAGSVVLLLLLAAALTRLLVLAGLLPEWLPFSWSGFGEELLVKPAGAFVGVLFLHLLRWLIRAGRRRLALTLVAATGPLFFCLGVMSFGAAQVFSRDVLASEAIIAWLVLLLVPAIFCAVVLGLEPVWLRTHARNAEPLAAEIRSQGDIMSVKKEPSGRRSIQVEVEVPGTPEEVWQAIATGPGISAWFVPAEFEERDGKPVAATLKFGPGMESHSVVTAWDPPRMITRVADGWAPGSPPIATEFTIEARAGGVCVVRVVNSLFASTDDWDKQLEGAESGWPGIFRILRSYLTHFRGQRSAIMKVMAPVAGTEAEAWAAMTAALGLTGVGTGQRWTAPAGVPALGGVAEHVSLSPAGALLRLDRPGPGTAALYIITIPGSVMATFSFYLYGDQAAGTVARETPLWQAWIQKRFPMPPEPSKSE